MTRPVALLRMRPRWVLGRAAIFAALCCFGIVYSSVAQDDYSDGLGRLLVVASLPLSIFGLAAVLGLVLTNVVQDFAVVRADESCIYLVYPFGLHRVLGGKRLQCASGAVPTLQLGEQRGMLATFWVRCGQGLLETRLGVAALEADFEDRFAERAERWAKSR